MAVLLSPAMEYLWHQSKVIPAVVSESVLRLHSKTGCRSPFEVGNGVVSKASNVSTWKQILKS